MELSVACCKEQTTFKDPCVQDFGLNPTDEDSRVPQFCMVTKLPNQSAATSSSAAASSTEQGLASGSERTSIPTRRLQTRSDEGKAKDIARQRQTRRNKRQTQAEAKCRAECLPFDYNRSKAKRSSSSSSNAKGSGLAENVENTFSDHLIQILIGNQVWNLGPSKKEGTWTKPRH